LDKGQKSAEKDEGIEFGNDKKKTKRKTKRVRASLSQTHKTESAAKSGRTNEEGASNKMERK